MFPLQLREPLSPVSRRPLLSYRRSYHQNSYGYDAPESFWKRNKSRIVVGGAIGLCCGTYFCQWTAEKLAQQGDSALHDRIRQNLINSVENIRERRWWVIFSSSFAHINLAHLGVNMFCLWRLGRDFVYVFGIPHFVGLWVFAAASCSLAQICWQNTQERLRVETTGRRWDKSPEHKILGISISRERALAISGRDGPPGPHQGGSAGASGVICGLTGLFVSFMPNMRMTIMIFTTRLWIGEVVFAAGSVFCMATGALPSIGHAGHLGGVAAGIAYYYGVARPWLRRTGRFGRF